MAPYLSSVFSCMPKLFISKPLLAYFDMALVYFDIACPNMSKDVLIYF